MRWLWPGAVTATSITVSCGMDGASSVRFVAATASDFTGTLHHSTAVTPDAQGVAKSTIDGLDPDTAYFLAVEADTALQSDPDDVGTFRTSPTPGTPTSFGFWFGSDQVLGSDHAVFDAMRARGAAFGLHLGNLHDAHEAGETTDPAEVRAALETSLTSPRFHDLAKAQSWIYTPHDTDSTSPSSWRDSAGMPALREVVTQYVPNLGLSADGSWHRTRVHGRVRIVVLDTRSRRDQPTDPDVPGKSLLGSAQKTWFKNLMLSAAEPLILVCSQIPWRDDASWWGAYPDEFAELNTFLAGNGLAGRTVMLSGGTGAVAADDGAPVPPEPPVPAGVVVGWPGTEASIPAGWHRVGSLDEKYLKSIPDGATDPRALGGAASHTHTPGGHDHGTGAHTHTAGDSPTGPSGAIASDPAGGGEQAADDHTHDGDSPASTDITGSTVEGPETDVASNDPLHETVIWIESDGTPSGIPDSAVAWFSDNDVPNGWTHHAASAGRFLRGADTGAGGGVLGGSAGHTHTGGTHTHATTHGHPVGTSGPPSSTELDSTTGDSGTAASPAHTHPVTHELTEVGDSGPADLAFTTDPHEPPFYTLALGQNTAGAARFDTGLIAVWTGPLADIPDGWVLCDGTNGTPNLPSMFVRNAADLNEVGTTGGATTHSHLGVAHDHTIPNHTHVRSYGGSSDGGDVDQTGTLATVATQTHDHDNHLSGASGGNTAVAAPGSGPGEHEPEHIEVAFIMLSFLPARQELEGLQQLTAGAFDQDSSASGVYSEGLEANEPGRGQYGWVQVTDDGESITLDFTGYRDDDTALVTFSEMWSTGSDIVVWNGTAWVPIVDLVQWDGSAWVTPAGFGVLTPADVWEDVL